MRSELKFYAELYPKEDGMVTALMVNGTMHSRLTGLLGEPVLNHQIRIEPYSSVFIRLPDGRIRSAVELLPEIQAAVPKIRFTLVGALRLGSVHSQYHMKLFIPFDSGASVTPSEGGSFNVPGSPPWGRLMRWSVCGEDWLDAETAKKVAAGFRKKEFWVASADMCSHETRVEDLAVREAVARMCAGKAEALPQWCGNAMKNKSTAEKKKDKKTGSDQTSANALDDLDRMEKEKQASKSPARPEPEKVAAAAKGPKAAPEVPAKPVQAPEPAKPPEPVKPPEPAKKPGPQTATASAKSPLVPFSQGKAFKDIAVGPEMVWIPRGGFEARYDCGGNRQNVSLNHDFAMGRFEVTLGEWEACVAGGGCNGYRPETPAGSDPRLPVTNVSFEDAGAYAAWLSERTGMSYRLPSRTEWEYVAMASTGEMYRLPRKEETVCRYIDENIYYKQKSHEVSYVRPVGSMAPNPMGVYDIFGNASEWTLDCHHQSNSELCYGDSSGRFPGLDGSPWLDSDDGDCSQSVIVGGSVDSFYKKILEFQHYFKNSRYKSRGFRVVRDRKAGE